MTAMRHKDRKRVPRQSRSEDAIAKIAKAVIFLLGGEGPGALTHRRVAEVAGVSLATTTYYYASKFDLIADAQARLLNEYAGDFIRVRERHRAGEHVVASLPDLVQKLLKNALGRHRGDTLAWGEIMLDCARDDRGHALARLWFDQIETIWTELLEELGAREPAASAGLVVDAGVGLLFLAISLRLSTDQARGLLGSRRALQSICAGIVDQYRNDPGETASLSEKSRDTCDRIINAAIAILEAQEPATLSYNAVALRAGLTNAAPAYHYSTIEELLIRAQGEVLRRMAEHQDGLLTMPSPSDEAVSPADLIATVLLRRLIEDGPSDVAGFQAWLNAARQPALRAPVARVIMKIEAEVAGFLRMAGIADHEGFAGLFTAQYLGRQIRLLATGKQTTQLARSRWEFGRTLASAEKGEHLLIHRAAP